MADSPNKIHLGPFKRSITWMSLRSLCRFFGTAAWRLKTYGLEHVPQYGGALLVGNHQSFLDPILYTVHIRRPVTFFARSGLFENKIFGWIIRNLHAFPVRQGEADVAAVRDAITCVQEGRLLNVYPEGSRTPDGEIQAMSAGAALIVRKAKVPVIPAAVDGSFDAWPRDRKLPRPFPTRVKYGPAMKLWHLRPAEIQERIEQEIRRLHEELRAMPRDCDDRHAR